MSDLNSLNKAANDVSSAVPICVLEAASKVVGKLSEMDHQKSQFHDQVRRCLSGSWLRDLQSGLSFDSDAT